MIPAALVQHQPGGAAGRINDEGDLRVHRFQEELRRRFGDQRELRLIAKPDAKLALGERDLEQQVRSQFVLADIAGQHRHIHVDFVPLVGHAVVLGEQSFGPHARHLSTIGQRPVVLVRHTGDQQRG